jgi:AcrR family transcriptional regulator
MPAAAARARVRAEMTSEITDAARRQLAEVGAAALSLRAVAREVGMVSSAVYRYFPSRDDLLTRLVIEGYDGVGAAAEAADDPAATPRARWMSVCRAVRRWAHEHPHEYALLYGSPVPGYQAPPDTIPAAARVGIVLGGIMRAAADAGELVPPSSPRPPRLVQAGAIDYLGGRHPAIDDDVRARAVLAWSSLFGAVTFELFGHLVGTVDDLDAWFESMMQVLVTTVGFRPPP